MRAGSFVLTGDGDQTINFDTTFTGDGNDIFVSVNSTDEVFPTVAVEATTLTGFEANRKDEGHLGNSTHTYIAYNQGGTPIEYYNSSCRVLKGFTNVLEFRSQPQPKINNQINTDFSGYEGTTQIQMSAGDELKFQPQIPSNTSVAGINVNISTIIK